MVAVEIDGRAVELLEETYPAPFTVLHSDVLAVDYTKLAAARGGRLSVIGNLPYYITSQILFCLCDHHASVGRAVVTMQHEVALRLVAKPRTKDYGILSVVFQLYASPKIAFKIPHTAFYPQPKVTSALVAIDLDPSFRSAKDEADAGFKKARRLRRGSAVVEGLLSESAERAEALSNLAAACAAAADDDALDIVAKRAAKRGAAPAAKPKPKAPPPSQRQKRREWTGRTFSSPAGVPILVGRSRRENDHLSLVIARYGDVWLHARNAPGAHVLLQLSRAPRFYREPDAACLAMAANLAAFYSDLRTEAKADVTYTSPKHISKPPKAPPGAVTLREELGNVVGRPDDVPDECKAKRDESGIASSW